MARKSKAQKPELGFLNFPGPLHMSEHLLNQAKELSGGAGIGTVDDLGFRPLYDVIANTLFPWCSTLTKGARYFFFSLAVQELALEAIMDGRQGQHAAFSEDPRTKARLLLPDFEKKVKTMERHLALSLSSIYPDGVFGIFGIRKAGKWLRDPVAPLKNRTEILSDISRYPHAIYRGSCSNLGMYAFRPESLRGVLEVALGGHSPFADEWSGHAKEALAELKLMHQFWSAMEAQSLTFADARLAIDRHTPFEDLMGLSLTGPEARFLKAKIAQTSPYVLELDSGQFRKLLKSGEIDLGRLAREAKDPAYARLFEAAYHVNAVTKPFRFLYESRAYRGEIHKLDRKEVQTSWKWLNKEATRANAIWAPIWITDYSATIEEWLGYAASKKVSLHDSLFQRANDVIAGRRNGKIPPHKRYQDRYNVEVEEDLYFELNPKESSFRLGNASLLLSEIFGAL